MVILPPSAHYLTTYYSAVLRILDELEAGNSPNKVIGFTYV